MKIIQTEKIAQQISQLHDVLDGETTQRYTEYLNRDEDIEQGNLIPVEVSEDEVEGYLADNYEGEEEAVIEEETPFDDVITAPFEAPEIEGEDVPEFRNTQEAMQWAIDNNRVVKIFYTTRGGAKIHRIVEPHHMFQAGNGNLILVTYDRSVRHIRAFIVPNIMDYSFTDKNFKQRLRVMPRSKGIKAMKEIKQNLVKVASALEEQKLSKSASIVKDSIQTLEQFRVAQYLGLQGYWLRNRRCWDNCYRHKRTTQPETPAQEVWMSCWDEYKKSIQDPKSGWEKYASEEDFGEIKITAEGEKQGHEKFIQEVEGKVENGMTTAEAIYDTIEAQSKRYSDKVIEASSDLMALAHSLNENGYKDLGDEISNLSAELLKEAGLWDGIKNFGKGVKDWWSRNFGGLKSIINSLKKLNQLANTVMRELNRSYQMTASGKKTIIIEAQLPPGGNPNYTPSGPAAPQTQPLPPRFRLVYNTTQNTIRELSALISQQSQNSPSLQYLDAAVRNLQNFVDQYDAKLNDGTLNETTMVPLLQNLVKMTNQSMAGINASMQQSVSQGDDPTTPQDESAVGGFVGGAPTGATDPGTQQDVYSLQNLINMSVDELRAAASALGLTIAQLRTLGGRLTGLRD